MAEANSTPRLVGENRGTAERVCTEIEDVFRVAYSECETAAAIIDAAQVLCALERAPSHHDTHPSHNIITGAGHAHGLRLANDTLPKMLEHARRLVQSSANDFDVMRENAIEEIRRLAKGGAA